MTVYVKIERINGRHDLVMLAAKLEPKGFDDRVEYNSGGWEDRHIGTIAPHLRFENEDDAIAYVLAYGGEVSRDLPEMAPGDHFLPSA